jgi:CheY-like chemotaxis protein
LGKVVKVLVIDDEAMIRDLAIKVLTRAGVEVLAADSGLAGIQMYAQNQNAIDIVILDFSMPGITGLETLQGLRELSPTLPCIMSSGFVMDSSQIPPELRPNVFFLQKPYRSKVLVTTLSDVAAAVAART